MGCVSESGVEAGRTRSRGENLDSHSAQRPNSRTLEAWVGVRSVGERGRAVIPLNCPPTVEEGGEVDAEGASFEVDLPQGSTQTGRQHTGPSK